MAETPARWDPFRELSPLTRIFEDFLGERRPPSAAPAPAVDIAETDDGYELSAEIPGVRRDELAIEVHDGVLTLRGEKLRSRSAEDGGRRRHWMERSYGPFTRSFRLPADAQADQVSASFEDGVLEVRIPKRPESKPRAIEIKERRGPAPEAAPEREATR
jgi:HSP20 family protein